MDGASKLGQLPQRCVSLSVIKQNGNWGVIWWLKHIVMKTPEVCTYGLDNFLFKHAFFSVVGIGLSNKRGQRHLC